MLNLICIICDELFGQTDDVRVTTCGHIFHFACLTQWLERSRTCPQCRAYCSPHNIFRLYFNSANLDTSSIDVGSLQEQLDNLKLQLKLKERAIRKADEENKYLIFLMNSKEQAIQDADAEIKILKELQETNIKTIRCLKTKLQKQNEVKNVLEKNLEEMRFKHEALLKHTFSACKTETKQILKTENSSIEQLNEKLESSELPSTSKTEQNRHLKKPKPVLSERVNGVRNLIAQKPRWKP